MRLGLFTTDGRSRLAEILPQCIGAADAIVAAIAGAGVTTMMLIAIGVPICGCAGSVRRSVPLLRCYIVCSVLGTASAVVSVGILIIIAMPTAVCLCDDVCFSSEYHPGDQRTEASRLTWGERNAICAPGLDAILSNLRFQLCVALALVGLQIAAAWVGRMLAVKVLESGDIPLGLPVAPVIAMPGEPLPAYLTSHEVQPLDGTGGGNAGRTGRAAAPLDVSHASVAGGSRFRVAVSPAPMPGHASQTVAPAPGRAYMHQV